jgi:hypothetical protein
VKSQGFTIEAPYGIQNSLKGVRTEKDLKLMNQESSPEKLLSSTSVFVKVEESLDNPI